MTLRSTLALTVVVATLSACGKAAKCEATDDARQACIDDAIAAGIDTTWLGGPADCSTYRSITRIDPILGPLQAAGDPDFDCQLDVWDAADCGTAEGLAQAQSEADACY